MFVRVAKDPMTGEGWRGKGKDGRAGLGGVGRVVWWNGGGDGEVVAVCSD